MWHILLLMFSFNGSQRVINNKQHMSTVIVVNDNYFIVGEEDEEDEESRSCDPFYLSSAPSSVKIPSNGRKV